MAVMSQITKAMHPTYHSIYRGLQTKKLYMKVTKNTNWRCLMTAVLNFTICGKTVSLTAWHTADMDSAQTNSVTNRRSTFPNKKCLQVFIKGYIPIFVLTNILQPIPYTHYCFPDFLWPQSPTSYGKSVMISTLIHALLRKSHRHI